MLLFILSLSLLSYLTNSQKTRTGSYIDCADFEACFDDPDGYSLNCIDNIDCVVDCIGKNTCQFATLTCPTNANCTVNCGDVEDDCKAFTIHAEQSSSLAVSCGDGAESCDEMFIWCPLTPGCTLSGLNMNNVNGPITIYAVQGLNDISISGTDTQPITLFCTEDYSKSCQIISDSFTSCDSGNNICETYMTPTSHPTISPTVSPTTPTAIPTISPSTSIPTTSQPTFYPTFNPTTSYPTLNPTTFNPTFNPSTYPTSSNPTARPTVTPIITTQPRSNEHVVAETTLLVDSEEFVGNRAQTNFFQFFVDNLYVLMIVASSILACCIAACVCCIFLVRNRKRMNGAIQKELKAAENNETELSPTDIMDMRRINSASMDIDDVDTMYNEVEIEYVSTPKTADINTKMIEDKYSSDEDDLYEQGDTQKGVTPKKEVTGEGNADV